jgi:cytochrome c biogenesis protein CcmG/thiol:disulfide interchange protein DsbE
MHDSKQLDPSLGQARRARTRPFRRRVAAGCIAIVLVGVAAFVATRPMGSASSAPPGRANAIGSVEEGVAVGQAPADFIRPGSQEPLLMDLDGRPVTLADFAGRPLWIVFWATWCVPCQEEATDILAAYHAHRPDGLAVLAIDIQEPTATVRAYVQGHDLDYTVALDPTATVRAQFGGVGLPAHVFLDRRGVIRDRYLGQLTAALMEQHLASIMAS